MAHFIRGEVEVESGLGLPRLTTAQREAYTPPAKGYKVFDIDLDRAYVWTGAAYESIATLPDGESYVLGSSFALTVDSIFTAIGQETSDRVQGDNDVQTLVFDEQTARLDGDNALQTQIGTLTGNLAALTGITAGEQTAQDTRLTSIEGMFDLATVPPTVGQTLVWDDTNSTFIPGTISADDRVLKAGDTMTGNLVLDNTAAIEITQDSKITFSQENSSNAFDVSSASGKFTIRHNAVSHGRLDIQGTTAELSTGVATNRSEFIVSNDGFDFNVGGTNILTVNSLGLWVSTRKFEAPTTVTTDPDATLTTKDYVDSLVTGQSFALDSLSDVDTTTTAPVAGNTLFSDGTNFVPRDAVKADVSDFVEADYVHVTGDETIAGIKTFSDDVTISGDLIVTGTTTTVNSTNTEIADSVITINAGETGAGVTAPTEAGLLVDRGTEINERLVWDETVDCWKVGPEGGTLRAISLTYQQTFLTTDWVAGSPNTLTILQATHNLPYNANEVFVVQLYDDTGRLTTVDTVINQTTGDVVISSVGASFDGRVIINK